MKLAALSSPEGFIKSCHNIIGQTIDITAESIIPVLKSSSKMQTTDKFLSPFCPKTTATDSSVLTYS